LTVPRITVVGSYATGLTMRVDRLPSSGETLLATGYRVDYGGKGSNQAVGCVRLGAHVSFVARIGQDSFGAMAQALYREEGINLAFVSKFPMLPPEWASSSSMPPVTTASPLTQGRTNY
jgi:ribokinase